MDGSCVCVCVGGRGRVVSTYQRPTGTFVWIHTHQSGTDPSWVMSPVFADVELESQLGTHTRGCVPNWGLCSNSPKPGTVANRGQSPIGGCVFKLMSPLVGVYKRTYRRVCVSVCLSVCQSDNWKSCERIMTKFLGGVGHGPVTKWLNFGDDPDHRPDPGVRSPKSRFTRLLKKLPTDFDEILWRAGMWPRDQLITFWCRSANSTPFTAEIHYLQFQRPLAATTNQKRPSLTHALQSVNARR